MAGAAVMRSPLSMLFYVLVAVTATAAAATNSSVAAPTKAAASKSGAPATKSAASNSTAAATKSAAPKSSVAAPKATLPKSGVAAPKAAVSKSSAAATTAAASKSGVAAPKAAASKSSVPATKAAVPKSGSTAATTKAAASNSTVAASKAAVPKSSVPATKAAASKSTVATTKSAAPKNSTADADAAYWARRAEQAHSANRAAYVSDPVAAIDSFNIAVQKKKNATTTTGTAAARRSLAGRSYKGPCLATNPVDQCWRCRANWAKDRKRLARCGMGFGHKATGGIDGKLYVVTDASDADLIIPKKGTLRYAVIQDRPLWIVFARDMIIRLQQELIVTGDKTIDGRGAKVHVTGAQITVQNVANIIIHGLNIHHSNPGKGGMIRDSKTHYGQRGESDGDGISIMGSSNIWIDHVSMYACSDGLIDVVDGSTAITISNGHFTKHDHVMLFGASDSTPKDTIMQITVAFNHFGKGLVQRMPRIRFGFVHVVNNDYTHWEMYAIGGGKNPTIISQGNRFRAMDNINFKEVTKREYTEYSEWKDWVWKSQEDMFLNGAFFTQSGGQNERRFDKLDFFQAKPGRFAASMTRFAGALNCRVGKKC